MGLPEPGWTQGTWDWCSFGLYCRLCPGFRHGAPADTHPGIQAGYIHPYFCLHFVLLKKYIPLPFLLATHDGLTLSPGAKRAGVWERGGCWVLGSGGWDESSGHILYWMPRKRHMAKIMAKSCKESRRWLVRLGPEPTVGLTPPKGKGAIFPGTGRGLTHHSLHTSAVEISGGKALPATGPFAHCSHGKKGALDIGSNSAPLFASSNLGPNTSLLWACVCIKSLPCTRHGFQVLSQKAFPRPGITQRDYVICIKSHRYKQHSQGLPLGILTPEPICITLYSPLPAHRKVMRLKYKAII